MADDIVPTLLDEITKDFQRQYKANRDIARIYSKIKSKTVTYKDANLFAEEVGKMLASSYQKFISVDSLPDGRMWFNIANRILRPTFHTNYTLIASVCDQAQKIFNESQSEGIGVVSAAFNENKLIGLIDKISNEENFENVAWLLDEPVVNFSQSIVDDYIRENAEFHFESGLTPKIRRTLGASSENGPCKWCRNLAGTYDYPNVPKDVYRRHERCRCTVEYIQDGKTQNVHTKAWLNDDETPAAKKKRIEREVKEKLAEDKRRAREEAIRQLMEENGWGYESADIYYRTNIAGRG